MLESEQGIIKSTAVETETPPASGKAVGSGSGNTRTGKREPASTRRLHPLIELTLARVREFLREPEVVFWVFVFPLLLVFALGLAFRNTGPEKIRVAIEKSEANDSASATIANALAQAKNIDAIQLTPAEAAQALRSGKVALVVRPADDGAAMQGSGDVATNE